MSGSDLPYHLTHSYANQ